MGCEHSTGDVCPNKQMSNPDLMMASPQQEGGFQYCNEEHGNCYVGGGGDGWYRVRYGRQSSSGAQCWYDNHYYIDSSNPVWSKKNIVCNNGEFCDPDTGHKTCWIKYLGPGNGETVAVPMEPDRAIPEQFVPEYLGAAEPYTVSFGAQEIVVIALLILMLVNLVFLVYRCCKTKAMKVAKGGEVNGYHGVSKPINYESDEEQA